MAIVYLGLGSNLGNKRKHLLTALSMLAERGGDILSLSGFHETVPFGFQSAHTFLNAAIRMETSLSPYELLALTQQIEWEMGRTSKSKDFQYADRVIDIDILMYDDLILETPDLVLPHPLMHERLFVLQSLVEIAPDLGHPVLGKTIAELYLEKDSKIVRP